MTTSTSGPAAETTGDLHGRAGPATASGTATAPAPAPGAPAGEPARLPQARGPVQAGRHRPAIDLEREAAQQKSRSKRGRLLLLFPILLVVVGVATWMGY